MSSSPPDATATIRRGAEYVRDVGYINTRVTVDVREGYPVAPDGIG